MRLLTFALAIITAAPATASPVYLSCVINGEGGAFPVNITVDEDAQRVTTAMPSTGFSERLAAVFSPAAVSFRSGMLSYEISRTDLKIARTLTIGGSVTTETGTCKVETTPKRAF